MDEEQQLWQKFLHSGRVVDYLRYRGLLVPGATAAVEGEKPDGRGDKTAFDNRGAGSAGISNGGGE